MKLKRFLVFCAVVTSTACGGGGSGKPSFPTADVGTGVDGGGSSGSTQTPPPAAEPPVLRDLVGDSTASDVARFLTQATFGPTEDDVLALYLDEANFSDWIDTQIALPQSEALDRLDAHMRESDLDPLDKFDLDVEWQKRMLVSDVLWETFVHGEDQLRQRVAFALSQIFVISDLSDALFNDARGIINYHDLLAEHAFGNYRDLLQAVTLNPMMGEYLSTIRNEKTDLSRNIRPDENYARELMQLFTIGLVELNSDGTVRLDGEGRSIPTYDQETIKGFASVFTGWMYANAPYWYWDGWAVASTTEPMKAFAAYHDTETKTLLNNEILPAGMTAELDLEAALDNVFAHPNVAPFVSKQLIQRLTTSNPSPSYVARVSSVFNDNGEGVKGDLSAVVRAILLDSEARGAALQADERFGKLKEPVLKITSLMRAFDVLADQPLNEDATAVTQTIRFFWPGYAYGQRPYGAASVFNFYRPDYSPANGLGDEGLVAPEFQILTEKDITAASNWGGVIIFNAYDFLRDNCEADIAYDSGVGCLFTRFDSEIEIARNASDLIDHLDMLMLNGQMSDGMRGILLDHIEPFDETQEQERLYRVAEATYLIWMSPEFAVQR